MAGEVDYNKWTKQSLVDRIRKLERDLKAQQDPASSKEGGVVTAVSTAPSTESGPVPSANAKPNKKSGTRKIDPSRYSTRLVAFKLAYLGRNYGGFEFQPSAPQPTIEEELWKALVKACIIFPKDPNVVNWEGCDYSKCGRTDKGVSAFGQVIGLRVRSNRPLPRKKNHAEEKAPMTGDRTIDDAIMGESSPTLPPSDAPTEAPAQQALDREEEAAPEKFFDDVADEMPYCRILNKLLPPEIRMLAWCPATPETFSARFDCRERQYRYFFTQPAFSPTPTSLESPTSGGSVKDGWLDVTAIREAAKKFEGLHDFRNFCRADSSKMVTNFERRVFESDIVEVEDVHSALPYLSKDEFLPSGVGDMVSAGSLPKVYYFHVRGSAFLWHQIRHMVSVLFLVGQGLEQPSVIDELLDVERCPRRPAYVMADEVPLVLWDCIFPDLSTESSSHGNSYKYRNIDVMDWLYLGEDTPLHMHGSSGLADQMWQYWREKKMDELLANQLFNLAVSNADTSKRRDPHARDYVNTTSKIFEGGNSCRLAGKYFPVMKRELLPAPEDIYDRYARRKGYANAAERREVEAKIRAEKAGTSIDVVMKEVEAEGGE